MNGVTGSFQPNFSPGGTAMLLHIAKPFLDDAEKAQGYLRSNRTWNVLVGKINLDALLFGKFRAKCIDPKNQPKTLQGGGVQLVGEGVEVGADLASTIP